jgi:hypothetical protein
MENKTPVESDWTTEADADEVAKTLGQEFETDFLKWFREENSVAYGALPNTVRPPPIPDIPRYPTNFQDFVINSNVAVKESIFPYGALLNTASVLRFTDFHDALSEKGGQPRQKIHQTILQDEMRNSAATSIPTFSTTATTSSAFIDVDLDGLSPFGLEMMLDNITSDIAEMRLSEAQASQSIKAIIQSVQQPPAANYDPIGTLFTRAPQASKAVADMYKALFDRVSNRHICLLLRLGLIEELFALQLHQWIPSIQIPFAIALEPQPSVPVPAAVNEVDVFMVNFGFVFITDDEAKLEAVHANMNQSFSFDGTPLNLPNIVWNKLVIYTPCSSKAIYDALPADDQRAEVIRFCVTEALLWHSLRSLAFLVIGFGAGIQGTSFHWSALINQPPVNVAYDPRCAKLLLALDHPVHPGVLTSNPTPVGSKNKMLVALYTKCAQIISGEVTKDNFASSAGVYALVTGLCNVLFCIFEDDKGHLINALFEMLECVRPILRRARQFEPQIIASLLGSGASLWRFKNGNLTSIVAIIAGVLLAAPELVPFLPDRKALKTPAFDKYASIEGAVKMAYDRELARRASGLSVALNQQTSSASEEKTASSRKS